MTREFKPDWTLGPAAILRAWLGGNLTVRALAVLSEDRPAKWDAAEKLITEVLYGKPLTQEHARVLARGTRIPSSAWLDSEAAYRADLAAGRTDVTGSR